jgi:hypothetical protein
MWPLSLSLGLGFEDPAAHHQPTTIPRAVVTRNKVNSEEQATYFHKIALAPKRPLAAGVSYPVTN